MNNHRRYRRSLMAGGLFALLATCCGMSGCGSGTARAQGCNTASSQHGGVHAILDLATAADRSRAGSVLDHRLQAAHVRCAAIKDVGGTSLDVWITGVTVAGARGLLQPGRLTFQTWERSSVPVTTQTLTSATVDPAFLPSSEGGSCSGIDCVPAGYVPRPSGIDNSMVTNASVSPDPGTGGMDILIYLDDKGTALMAQVTTPLAQATMGTPEDQLAMFVDNQLVDNAMVQAPLTSGSVRLSGGNIGTNADYRNRLVAILAGGPLPAQASIRTIEGR